MLLLSIFPLCLITGAASLRYRKHALQMTQTYCVLKVIDMRRKFDSQVEALSTVSATIIYGQSMQSLVAEGIDAGDYLEYLQAKQLFESLRFVVQRRMPVSQTLHLLYPQDTYISSGDSSFDLAAHAPELEAHLADSNGRIVLLPSVFESDEQLFITSRFIRDLRDHSVRGYVHVMARSELFREIAGEPLYGGATHIIGSDGEIIFSTDSSSVGDARLAVDGKQTGAVYSDRGRRNLLVASKSKVTDWTIAFTVPYANLFSDINSTVGFVAVFGMVLLAVCFTAIYIVSQSIVGPLVQLGHGVAKIENNEFDCTLDTLGNDELSQISSAFNAMSGRIKYLIHEVYDVTIKEKDAELRALQSQIKPHFLFNTLDSIRWEARKEKAFRSALQITMLADFFRLGLAQGANIVTIEDEIRYTRLYLSIQEIRYRNQLHVEWAVDKSVLDCRIVKLVLQPLVENSIVHGLEGQENDMHLTIRIQDLKTSILITVSDDGRGVEGGEIQASLKDGDTLAAYGLVNVDKRLKFYFGESYGLGFQSTVGEGSEVTVSIPRTYDQA